MSGEMGIEVRKASVRPSVSVGMTATVPEWRWVTVKNLLPIKSLNNEFEFGDACGISQGGMVVVIAVDGNRVLVEYAEKGAGMAAGKRAPSGTIFFLPILEFFNMTPDYEVARKKEQDKKNHVSELLERVGMHPGSNS